MSKCTVCGAGATDECSRCGGPAYCGVECQTLDWTKGGHNLRCQSMQFNAPYPGPRMLKEYPDEYSLDGATYLTKGAYGVVVKIPGDRIIKFQFTSWKQNKSGKEVNQEVNILREVEGLSWQFNPYTVKVIDHLIIKMKNVDSRTFGQLRIMAKKHRLNDITKILDEALEAKKAAQKRKSGEVDMSDYEDEDDEEDLEQHAMFCTVIEYIEGVTLKSYLDDNRFPITKDKFMNLAFGLLWSFYTMQLNLGLTHNDLHAANIMMRVRNDNTVKLFAPQGVQNRLVNTVYTLPSAAVDPVVIDFGMATTNASRRAQVSQATRDAYLSGKKTEWHPGYFQSYPMEWVIKTAERRGAIGISSSLPRRGEGSDNWAIGRILLAAAFHGTPIGNYEDTFASSSIEWVLENADENSTYSFEALATQCGIVNVFTGEVEKKLAIQLFTIAMMQHMLHGEFVPRNSGPENGYKLEADPDYELTDILIEMSKNKNEIIDMMMQLPNGNFYANAMTHAREKIGDDGVDMIKKLFTWTPWLLEASPGRWVPQSSRPCEDVAAGLYAAITHPFFNERRNIFEDALELARGWPVKWYGYGWFD